MTVAEFIALHDKFKSIDPSIIQPKIDLATITETAFFWGTKREYAIGLKAAAMLYNEHFSPQLTKADKDGGNRYQSEYESMRERHLKENFCGFILI